MKKYLLTTKNPSIVTFWWLNRVKAGLVAKQEEPWFWAGEKGGIYHPSILRGVDVLSLNEYVC